MYGGYSGLGGGYSGYGGLGSSYSGYGGLGSSSYGGIGSSYGSYNQSRLTPQTVTNEKGQKVENADPNKPADPRQPQDKKVVEEWFMMMGGLRSILQLGVAFLALANFSMTASDLVSKFIAFSKEKATSIVNYIDGKLPKEAISRLMTPERRTKIMKLVMMVLVRVFAVFLLGLGMKMRRDIRKEAQKKHEDMLKEMKELKGQDIQMENESEIQERHMHPEINHDANL